MTDYSVISPTLAPIDDPYRYLALSVLLHALREALGVSARIARCSRDLRARIRAEARTWCTTPSPALTFWCEVAGIDPDDFMRLLQDPHLSKRLLRFAPLA